MDERWIKLAEDNGAVFEQDASGCWVSRGLSLPFIHKANAGIAYCIENGLRKTWR